MTRQSPPELFVSERPVRSDFARADMARERVYARRRKITLLVLVLIIGAGIYAFVGHRSTNPADIPTIKAETDYKQKPTNPGGIDIPHQDVRVYDQLEGKNGAPAAVEHLLPPPEKPKDIAVAAAVPEAAVSPAPSISPAPIAAAPSPTPSSQQESILPVAPTKSIVTTVTSEPVAPIAAPAASAPPVAPAAKQELSIEQVIKDTQKSSDAVAPKVASPTAVTAGMVSIQLASMPDEAKARAMAQDLQKKYATELAGATLQTVRADLGSRGIFYRIQSQGMNETDANHICASLKQVKAQPTVGCILVRK